MIVVSHRGPYSFTATASGEFTAKRGAGGVVSALAPLLESPDVDTTWIAAAISDDDRAACRAGIAHVDTIDLRLLVLDPEAHRLHYDVVSNEILWFLHHGLFGFGDDPTFGAGEHAAIDAYYDVNRAFANAVCDTAADGEQILVQDYQLALVPGFVREARPDLRVQHFTHTPFCGPQSITVLPDAFARDMLRSLGGGPAGFHTARWAQSYSAATQATLGAPPTHAPFVAPLGPDADELQRTAASPEVAHERAQLDELAGDRRVIVRADRLEPSKNLVRGFRAYEQLLADHRELRERVVFVAMLYGSRQTLAVYRSYADEVRDAVDAINNRFATAGWQPIVVDERDHFARTVAGMQRADVLFVNPVKDGLNLVAKEGPLVNERNAVLCLSREAGAYAELAPACEMLHPFDLRQQAGALHVALTMPAAERAERAAALRTLAAVHSPSTWLRSLLAQQEGVE